MPDDNTLKIKDAKSLLRKRLLSERRAMTEDERAERSEVICAKLLDSDEYKNADTILLYKAYNNEVDTDLIFERAVSDGKTVAYPRSEMIDGEPHLYFYITDDILKLKSGYKGILEPDTGSCPVLFEGRADVCIVPGAVFDRKCHRIGYGKAFYDRYIRINCPRTVIGLAYDIQIVDVFEVEESDRSVDMVITDLEVYRR